MDRARVERKTPRFRTQVRIFFTAGDLEGEGVILDLSKGGCRVQCETTVAVGTEIEAHVYFPDYEWPLKIQRAVVHWVDAEMFGVEFLDLLPAQRSRLRAMLADKKFIAG